MKSALVTLCFLLSLCSLTFGQDAASSDPPPPVVKIGLKMIAGDGQVSFNPVTPKGTGDLWLNHYPRVASWKEPENTLPILALRVRYRMEGQQVKVTLTIHRGKKFYETEELVAERLAGLGESFVVRELTYFGIEPFTFEVVNREEVRRPEISLSSTAQSVEVLTAKVEPMAVALKVRLRNNSQNAVMSLEIQTLRKGRVQARKWPLGHQGHAIIEPGAEAEMLLPADGAGAGTAGGYMPLPVDGVAVVSALFADGSYEGELLPAAKAAGHYAGYRIQLVRVLGVIEQALRSVYVNEPGAAEKFSTEVTALGCDAEPAEVGVVFDAYPGLKETERAEIKASVEVAMCWLRRDTSGGPWGIGRQTGTEAGVPRSFRDGLERMQERFREWLGRLER